MKKPKSTPEPAGLKAEAFPVRFVESDGPNGPWTPIPEEAILSQRYCSDDEARRFPGYYWMRPIDCQTVLGAIDGAKQVLSFQQLRTIQRHLGDQCTMGDLQAWLAKKRIHIEDVNWSVVLILLQDAGSASAEQTVRVDEDAHYSPKRLAEKYSVKAEPLRKALERLRKQDHNCFVENENRAGNEPQYLYKLSAALPIIERMRQAEKTSRLRPA